MPICTFLCHLAEDGIVAELGRCPGILARQARSQTCCQVDVLMSLDYLRIKMGAAQEYLALRDVIKQTVGFAM